MSAVSDSPGSSERPSAPGIVATASGTPWRLIDDPVEVVDAILAVYADRGTSRYDEVVTQTAHAEQSAALAVADGAADALIAAALLHDLGHLLLGEHERQPEFLDRDLHHEDIAARFLANWFPPAVIAPVRHHVAAKRYLCAVDAGYHATLSPASVRSLELQGGTMTAGEASQFAALPGAEDAARLRRWDDLAKDPTRSDPPLAAYRDLLAALVTAGSARPHSDVHRGTPSPK